MSVGPLLATARLELWRPQAGDRAALFELVRSESVHRFLGPPDDEAGHFARFMRNAGSWWLYGYGAFTVRERGRPEIVGGCGVFHSRRGFGKGMDDVPEAGWIVAAPHWGKGYASEAMTAALAWFDATHAAPRTVCMIEEGHAASEAVAARLGYVQYDRHEPDEGRPLRLYERLLVTSPIRRETPA